VIRCPAPDCRCDKEAVNASRGHADLSGLAFAAFILQKSPPPSRAQIEASVRSATRMFLAAYGRR
jgi:hypothetical protein